jgi:hypothetical protein
MRDVLEKRLNELRTEFECGQKLTAELEARQTNVRSSLLRISGAIQVLEELLKNTESNELQTTTAGIVEK